MVTDFTVPYRPTLIAEFRVCVFHRVEYSWLLSRYVFGSFDTLNPGER
jgi:hypothetical protein